ncbi:hypothetical protein HYPSUDRAFT_210170 [Hypholoma sublateritium FD-334 SS-4]|uniref:Uncharacterized protein n=1 Tax=Hypholoma sublateritium (strain FD-334 SS-4) TaxID=945553 RepID=A0A0D2NW23_HYPSF|nr:hypothetical protein HYPSUDRAFT_210170 [Hypholoma sublateritium FD-334 SS-4]
MACRVCCTCSPRRRLRCRLRQHSGLDSSPQHHPLPRSPAPSLAGPRSARRLGQDEQPAVVALTHSLAAPIRAAAVCSPLTRRFAAECEELRQAHQAVPVPAHLRQLSTRCIPAVAPGTPQQHRRRRAAVTAADSHSRLHSGEPAQARSHHRYRHLQAARGQRLPQRLPGHIRHLPRTPLPPSSSPPSPTPATTHVYSRSPYRRRGRT